MTPHVSRMQWAVRAVLALGVAASVTANILHARDNPISQAIAAWPPLALLVTVELVTRVPVYNKALGVARIVATAAIAGIAAWISYHHMVGVVARYGETGTVPYLLPLSVDGLIVVASICLVELAGRRTTSSRLAPAAPPTAEPTPSVAAERPVVTSTLPAGSGTAPSAPVVEGEAQPVSASSAHLTVEPVGDRSTVNVRGDLAAMADLAPVDDTKPSQDAGRDPIDDVNDDDQDENDDAAENSTGDEDDRGDLAPDLVPLLPAARIARDELIREGRTVSRDALAHRLRRNGHAIRNTRVSELLTALRREEPSPNGARPAVSA